MHKKWIWGLIFGYDVGSSASLNDLPENEENREVIWVLLNEI